jgi:hypothetical protein
MGGAIAELASGKDDCPEQALEETFVGRENRARCNHGFRLSSPWVETARCKQALASEWGRTSDSYWPIHSYEKRVSTTMKRFLLFVAVVVLMSIWSKSAFAQYGIPSFGGGGDSIADMEAEKNQIKQNLEKYGKRVPKSQKAKPSLPRRTQRNPYDPTGRSDLSGRPVSSYPTVRGDISSFSYSLRRTTPNAIPNRSTPRRSARAQAVPRVRMHQQ